MLLIGFVLGTLASASAFAPGIAFSCTRPGSCVLASSRGMAMQDNNRGQMSDYSRTLERPLPPLPSSLENMKSRIPELFNTFDNGSGRINVAQLQQVLGRNAMKHTWKGRDAVLDRKASQTSTDELFKRADLDGNGFLDFDEFERLLNWYAWQHLCSHRYQPAPLHYDEAGNEETNTVELRNNNWALSPV